MREFFIQIKDGQPFEHPIARENMQQLFPEHDLERVIPDNFAVFNRKPHPILSPYQRINDVEYGWEGDYVTDIFNISDLSPDEKFSQQEAVKLNFKKYSGYESWVFDEDTCSMIPPKPYPGNQDGTGARFMWDEAIRDWVDVTSQPVQRIPNIQLQG